MTLRYEDRRDAGRQLARQLAEYVDRDDVLILALPRGGVPVAYEVARELDAALDVLVVRKLGVPGHPEFAMGAIASAGVEVLDRELIQRLHLSQRDVEAVALRERQELARRDLLYRGNRPPARLRHHTVIVVDDGFATGASMNVALQLARSRRPDRLVAAAPVGPPEIVRRLAGLADQVVCPYMPPDFHAVGQFYRHFDQVEDEEVRDLLASARMPDGGHP